MEKLENLTIDQLNEKRDFYENEFNKSKEKLHCSYIWDKENSRYKNLEKESKILGMNLLMYSQEIILRKQKEEVSKLKEMIFYVNKGE